MLLIIQNGYITPYISRYLDEEFEIVKSFEKDVSKLDINKYTIIIILGGYQSVTRINDYPYLLNVVKLIKKCLDIEKPLFGICLGCQLIAHTLGCEIKSSGKLNIGYDTNILGYDNIFRCHIDYIVPNKKIDILEYYDNMPYLYKHKNHIYGIQCHPDIAPECVQKYSNNNSSFAYAKENKETINKKNSLIISKLLDNLRNGKKYLKN
ncbi:glutamine amidotransferase-like protein [Tupanvirus soda lake]|uniref:Glutamine amidotransferase-like protein n=2 Tax=Tupanvirus TaxID=2094720 RepID=A0A6N1NXI6_9VIRU|nr:glutamine amidotransferase-like protein [Tupanvirus soda lake]QKU35918.1 glutamine amidotransferase-like protein [Tupanvirus soda lake]